MACMVEPRKSIKNFGGETLLKVATVKDLKGERKIIFMCLWDCF
jgi:hypothetical protein